jgi:hypothetical protein
LWQQLESETIDREFGYAEKIGFNSTRVFLQYAVFEAYPKEFLERLEVFLELSEKHGLSVMPVFFDDCWGEEPALGPQLPPILGAHNSRWVGSPGTSKKNPSYYPKLKDYVKKVVGAHSQDKRIIAWDLYNEPKLAEESHSLVHNAFKWAREAKPMQPLTSCWYGNLLSDVVSIHFYMNPEKDSERANRVIQCAKSYGKPILATEILGRPNHGELHQVVPLLSNHEIGWYLWELMIGVDQTRYQWPKSPKVDESIVFQGLIYPDGKPYSEKETQLIHSLKESNRAEEQG